LASSLITYIKVKTTGVLCEDNIFFRHLQPQYPVKRGGSVRRLASVWKVQLY